MDIKSNFTFAGTVDAPPPPFPEFPGEDLGPLSALLGTWKGEGFNVIWRPDHVAGNPSQDRFLMLSRTIDTIEFEEIPGPIPNRGFLQGDIDMFGVTYLQKISDAVTGNGLHAEPGVWAVVPATTHPPEPHTVVRMASIPHGTVILAQGTAMQGSGVPPIPDNNILPFPIGDPGHPITFPEQELANPTAFRTPPNEMTGVTQDMVNNPNSVLKNALAGQEIDSLVTLLVSTSPAPVPGGGTANTAFLQGVPQSVAANAEAKLVTAMIWIETVKGNPDFLQLQYTQTVLLNFNTLSWPHITVGTLRKLPPTP
ncbi:MAG TPA: heme-binding protein [Candidatus Acidoferrales bacterium]|nr:heme-binding protein [Candidatus Acidoferrales bacterium]